MTKNMANIGELGDASMDLNRDYKAYSSVRMDYSGRSAGISSLKKIWYEQIRNGISATETVVDRIENWSPMG